MKRALGFKYTSSAKILYQIDNMANQAGEISLGLTKEFAEKWCKKQPNESNSYYYGKISLLIQFSLFLKDLGIESYIPKLPHLIKSTFTPYIYSRKEIDDIFKACDELILQQLNTNSCIISIPAIIRLLYGTGLRISEAISIKNKDIDLEEKYIRVKDCKNNKERIIPISDSLVSVCKEYLKYRNILPLGINTGYFFVRLNGNKCSENRVRGWFNKCLDKAGISYVGRKHGPRIHDLRHTFAVTSLANMAEAGIDLYASLPILSNYLGHQSLSSTNHYVRLTANMYPELIKNVNMICLDVFPKFKNYEAN